METESQDIETAQSGATESIDPAAYDMDRPQSRSIREVVVRLLEYASPYKSRIAAAILILMIAVVLDMAGPYFGKIIIDDYLVHYQDPNFDFTPIVYFILLFIVILVLSGVFHFIQSLMLQKTALAVVKNMRMDLMRHVQRLPVRFFDNTPAGRIVNRISNDTESIRELYMSFMATFVVSTVQVIGIYAFMFVLDARLALYCLLLLPLFFAIVIVLMTVARKYWMAMRRRISDMNTLLSESILIMPVLQLFRREQETIDEFEEMNADWQRNNNKQLLLASLISRNLIGIVGSLATAGFLWYFGGLSLQNAVEFGVVYAFVSYIGRFFEPVIAIFDQIANVQRAQVAAERVFDLLDQPVEVADGEERRAPGLGQLSRDLTDAGAANGTGRVHGTSDELGGGETGAVHADCATDTDRAASAVRSTTDTARSALAISGGDQPLKRKGHVEFENVWFAYKGNDYVLKGISFEASQGQTIALVGHTGSGKSSIMNLLLGFYAAQKGSIRIDGENIRDIPGEELRKDMAIVLQDPFLFAGDIRFNVGLYNEQIDDEQVRDALKRVGADTFVSRLPQDIHEPVIERGSTLSAGQRQLITFARALAYDPSILILDEATASVDSETEELIQRALNVVSEGRTTFIIAHRLSTIRDADQILVLHKGEILERGTHQELMARKGRYFTMYELQKGGTQASGIDAG